MIRNFVLLSAIFMLSLSPVSAAEINDAGEKRLKTLFTNMLDQRKTAIEARGGKLETDGDIVIEQADTYYAVTLPAMSLTNDDDMIGKVGLIAINATPTDAPDNWKMSIAIPTPILYEDKDGNPTMRLEIGEQEMGGIWNGSLENFSKLSAKYANIKLSHYKKKEILNIGQFNIAADLKENKKDYWTGPTKISLQNISIIDGDDKKLLGLGDARILMDIDNFSPKKRNEVLKLLSEQSENTEETISSLPALVMGSIGDSFSLEGVLKNLKIKGRDNAKIGKEGVSLASANFGLSMADLNKDNIKQNFKLSFSGLKNPKNDELAPTNMNIDLQIDKLPLRELLGLAEKIMPKGDDKAAAKQVAAMQTMLTAPKILASAGTTMTLTDTKYGNDIYSGDLNGKLTANSASMFGTTGEIIFAMRGVEKLIEALKDKADHKKTSARLKAIQKVCNTQGEGAEQKNVCHFKLDESAKLTVNGQDMEVLLEAMSGEEDKVKSEDTTKDR